MKGLGLMRKEEVAEPYGKLAPYEGEQYPCNAIFWDTFDMVTTLRLDTPGPRLLRLHPNGDERLL